MAYSRAAADAVHRRKLGAQGVGGAGTRRVSLLHTRPAGGAPRRGAWWRLVSRRRALPDHRLAPPARGTGRQAWRGCRRTSQQRVSLVVPDNREQGGRDPSHRRRVSPAGVLRRRRKRPRVRSGRASGMWGNFCPDASHTRLCGRAASRSSGRAAPHGGSGRCRSPPCFPARPHAPLAGCGTARTTVVMCPWTGTVCLSACVRRD